MEKVEVKFEKLVEVRLVQEQARLPAIFVVVSEKALRYWKSRRRLLLETTRVDTPTLLLNYH